MWELDCKECWELKNWCFWTATLENILDLDCKIKPVNPKGNQSWIFKWKDWCWSWSSNTLATWCEELTHLNKPWCWERLKAGGEGDDGGCDGWMEAPIRWAWVSTSSRIWWRTVSPGMLQSTGLQRVRHDWKTELNWTYHIANTICNGHVSPARLGLPMAPTYIPNQICTHAQKSVPSIHKPFSEFWLQGDLHFSRQKGLKNTFIPLSVIAPK